MASSNSGVTGGPASTQDKHYTQLLIRPFHFTDKANTFHFLYDRHGFSTRVTAQDTIPPIVKTFMKFHQFCSYLMFDFSLAMLNFQHLKFGGIFISAYLYLTIMHFFLTEIE